MDDIKNIQVKLYEILSDSGVSGTEEIAKKATKETGREMLLQKAKEIEKTLQEKYKNKYLWQIVKEGCEKRGAKFDERREEDKAVIKMERSETECEAQDINGMLAYYDLMSAYTKSIDMEYNQCELRGAVEELRRLIGIYLRDKRQDTMRIIGNVIGYSSRQTFIVAFMLVVFEAYPKNINALRDLAKRFQIGKYQEDKIMFCHMQRFWEGYGWILRLANALGLLEGCDEEEFEHPEEKY